LKFLSAVCATSAEVKRLQIQFNESTGLIEAVGDLNIPREKIDFFFGDHCLLFAGMGDVHIHAREDVSGKNNYKEDFTTARAAMVNGGVTHAGDMPNNPIPPVDDATYEQKLKLSFSKVHGDLWIYAGIGPLTRPLSYPVPYKVYMGPSIGDLFFKDLTTLDETLKHYQGQNVSFHCEDPVILDQHKNEKYHHERRPVEAEVVATRDALMLIEKYQLKGKLCHYSTGEGLLLIREARSRGAKVQIEVTPQHLYFSMEELQEKDYRPLQMNPPIRYKHDKEVLLSALKNGEIDYLATDHAPHTQAEKDDGHSGLTGLDTYGGFVTWLLENGVDAKMIARVSAENPGEFFNNFLESWKKIIPAYSRFGKGLGKIAAGYRANFTILNLKKPMTVTKDQLKTKVGHSPFLGHSFPGSVEATFVGGQKA
jgi:dihydroorotase